MMFAALVVAYFAFAAFDAWITRKRVLDYGIFVECNPAIVWLSIKTNPEIGTIIGIMVPAAAIAMACMWTHFEVGFAVLVGMRLKQFTYQLSSLKFESDLREMKEQLDASQTLPSDANATPPICPSQEGEQAARNTFVKKSKDE